MTPLSASDRHLFLTRVRQSATLSDRGRLSADQVLSTSSRDSFEPRVHAERLEKMPDVVADRLDAQMKLAGDLTCRRAALKQAQDLNLPGCQMGRRRLRLLLIDVHDLPEDPDDPMSRYERHGADLDADAIALSVENNDVLVGHFLRSRELAREVMSGAKCFLRRHDRRELAPADVSDETSCGRIDPANHTGRVDQIARNAHRFERYANLSLDRLQPLQRLLTHGATLA